MKIIKHVVFVIMLLMLSSPIVVNAEYSNYGSKPSGYDSSCKNYLNISITANPYNRKTTMNTDDTSKRKITMKCKGRCKAYIYYADYGTLDALESGIQISDEDEETPDNDIKLKKKTFSDSWEWYLPAGREALVVVISVKKKNCDDEGKNCTYSEKIAVKDYCPADKIDSNGNCTVTRFDIKCPKGRFESSDNLTEAGDVNIKGNGAALFVQNPKESGLVPNLRHKDAEFGQACKNAYNGVYDGDSSNKDLYSITKKQGQTEEEYQSILADYRNNYYGRFLKYCDEQSVAFNLKASSIKKMSNALLRTFYEAQKLNEEDYLSIEEVEAKIEEIEKTLDPSHVFNRKRQLNTSLSCRSNTSVAQSESYLYKEGNEVSVTLSNSQKVSVCKTKCYEHLTVKYDPPAVVKAGLCFQYKVTVKSVSECGVEKNYSLDNITIPNMCSPSPICENKSGHTQAGPNEDFDNCVKKCDGGEYTQKCINSCYNKVYKNNSKTTPKNTATSSHDITLSSESIPKITVLDNSNKSVIKKLSNKDYSSTELEKYYNENNNPTCKTEKIINYVHNGNNNKLDECAEYFFQAKALNPYGSYKSNGTVWDPDDIISNAGAEEKATTNIPMQIARSSPFYLRSVTETKNLLVSLVVPAVKTDYWKKYNIDENGIKRQYSSRWICNQTCTYTGCNSGDVYTSAKFSNNIISDLEKIEAALQKCKASAACDTEEKQTTFSIKIDKTNSTTSATSNYQAANGRTTLGSTVGSMDDFPADYSMFAPEEGETGTGISGLCYDNNSLRPHYKTTITYPGTWINLKNGKREFTEQDLGTHKYKDELFCTPYDAENVNQEYWRWAVNNHYTGSLPPDFTPKYNINATLGSNGYGFGKYNWKINLKCFYALSNCVNGNCDETDKKNECGSENSTELCNTKFRVVTSENLFPDEDGNPKEESQIPFNWTKAAQDNSPEVQAATASNYGIDPSVYKEQVEASAAFANTDPSSAAYRVKINKENIKNIKQYVSNYGYTSYRGTYRKVDGIDLYYYISPLANDTSLSETWDRNTELGVNK